MIARRSAGWEMAVGGWRLAAGLVQPRRAGARGLAAIGAALWRHRLSFGALGEIAAVRDPDGLALVDDDGPLTYAELHHRAESLAAEVLAAGPDVPERIGVLGRNGRGFVIAALAAFRAGADVVLLNPDLGAPAMREVLTRQRVRVVLADGDGTVPRPDCRVLEVPAAGADVGDLPRPARTGRLIVLTSGTTGAPKGADRGPVRVGQAIPITTLTSRIPVRPGEPMLLLPPMFHGYGFGFLSLALGFGAPLLLARRFDAATAAGLLTGHRARTVVAVPPMLPRLAAALNATDGAADGTADGAGVRAVVTGAGPLHPAVAEQALAAFGPVLFNLYGSTELGWSTLATPADLSSAPGTIGRPAAGVTIAVLDDDGRPVPDGAVGRICVGSRLAFSRYTDSDRRPDRLAGLADTGDLGHRDGAGLLHVDGRSDDIVVTGGEKVFPAAVENALLSHPAVAEARVDGVPDPEFGARLVATVVPRAPVAAGTLQEYVAARLAPYQMPREIRFAEALPRTASGKPVRRRVT